MSTSDDNESEVAHVRAVMNNLPTLTMAHYGGVRIRLDGPFVYHFPMSLFQTWEQLWAVSFELSVARMS